MKKQDAAYKNCIAILNEELIPAMGCTEPVAVAYAAAQCRKTLGLTPEKVRLVVSGPIIKNVKSVVVPNTGDGRGLTTSVAAGIVGGDADAALEVLEAIKPEQHEEIRAYMANTPIEIVPSANGVPFYIDITCFALTHTARVVISAFHTNIVLIERDGEKLFEKEQTGGSDYSTDRSALTVESIWEFANTVDTEDVRSLIERQISYNTAISEEGMRGHYGAEIGRTLMNHAAQGDIRTAIRAAAAAGSDARMGGCELPVVIASGSGNQGMTTSLPVITYAKLVGCSNEKLIRALVLASLLTIHQKTGIGRISAYCGAVSAGASAGCGIAYIDGCDLTTVNHVIVNTLAICSGMVCDGAKASCAAKISAAVDAGYTGYLMYKDGHEFFRGDGIVKSSVEKTITAVGKMAREGMRETDAEILSIMLDE